MQLRNGVMEFGTKDKFVVGVVAVGVEELTPLFRRYTLDVRLVEQRALFKEADTQLIVPAKR